MGRRALDFVAKEEGVTSIEYGIIAAIIVLAIVGIVSSIGTDVTRMFSLVENGYP